MRTITSSCLGLVCGYRRLSAILMLVGCEIVGCGGGEARASFGARANWASVVATLLWLPFLHPDTTIIANSTQE